MASPAHNAPCAPLPGSLRPSAGPSPPAIGRLLRRNMRALAGTGPRARPQEREPSWAASHGAVARARPSLGAPAVHSNNNNNNRRPQPPRSSSEERARSDHVQRGLPPPRAVRSVASRHGSERGAQNLPLSPPPRHLHRLAETNTARACLGPWRACGPVPDCCGSSWSDRHAPSQPAVRCRGAMAVCRLSAWLSLRLSLLCVSASLRLCVFVSPSLPLSFRLSSNSPSLSAAPTLSFLPPLTRSGSIFPPPGPKPTRGRIRAFHTVPPLLPLPPPYCHSIHSYCRQIHPLCRFLSAPSRCFRPLLASLLLPSPALLPSASSSSLASRPSLCSLCLSLPPSVFRPGRTLSSACSALFVLAAMS